MPLATFVPAGLDLREQGPRRAPALLGSMGIGLERLLQLSHICTEFAEPRRALVNRLLHFFWRSQPTPNCVARQACALGYLMQRHLVAHVHASNSSQHFHSDHLDVSLPNIWARQVKHLGQF